MKFTADRKAFTAAAQLAAQAVGRSSHLKSILKGVHVAADAAGGLALSATDLETGVRVAVAGAAVGEPGAAVLPADRLLAVLRELDAEELHFEAAGAGTLLRAGPDEFEFPGEDPAAFPGVPDFAEESYHEVAAAALARLVRRTLFAASAHARFAATAGLLAETPEGKFALVASDGYCLSRAEAPAAAAGGHAAKGRPVIPAAALKILAAALPGGDEPVRLALRPNDALFQTPSGVLVTRLVEGRYPDYQRMLPKAPNLLVPLPAGELLAALRRAAAAVSDEGFGEVLFTFGDRTLTLAARGEASGRSRVELATGADGKGFACRLGVKRASLLDMLRACDPAGELTLDLLGPTSPVVVRPAGGDWVFLMVAMDPNKKGAS